MSHYVNNKKSIPVTKLLWEIKNRTDIIIKYVGYITFEGKNTRRIQVSENSVYYRVKLNSTSLELASHTALISLIIRHHWTVSWLCILWKHLMSLNNTQRKVLQNMILCWLVQILSSSNQIRFEGIRDGFGCGGRTRGGGKCKMNKALTNPPSTLSCSDAKSIK